MSAASNPAIYFEFFITGALTDNGTWDTIPIAQIGASGTFTNAMPVIINVDHVGNLGAAPAVRERRAASAGDRPDRSNGTERGRDASRSRDGNINGGVRHASAPAISSERAEIVGLFHRHQRHRGAANEIQLFQHH